MATTSIPATSPTTRDRTSGAKIAASIGRIAVLLGILALVGAWITELTGRPFLGLSQQHLFLDAIALTSIGIAFLVDAILHTRGI